MNYKFEKGSVVVLRDRLYLGEAKVVGYRNILCIGIRK